jgi:hypothetical protein
MSFVRHRLCSCCCVWGTVGKFVSLEARQRDLGMAWQYALEECSVGWDVGEQRYAPFVERLLVTTARQGQKKSERIESLLYRAFSPMRKDEIMLMAPDISKAMVEKVLADLLCLESRGTAFHLTFR